jgi:hypothetical protein
MKLFLSQRTLQQHALQLPSWQEPLISISPSQLPLLQRPLWQQPQLLQFQDQQELEGSEMVQLGLRRQGLVLPVLALENLAKQDRQQLF